MQQLSEQFWRLIDTANKIAIIGHQDRLGDTLSACLGLYSALSEENKSTDLLLADNRLGNYYDFLPNYHLIKSEPQRSGEQIIKVDLAQAKPAKVQYQQADDCLKFIITMDSGGISQQNISLIGQNYPYDLIIAIACPDWQSFGELYEHHAELFFNTPIINIDCSAANDNYGQINIVDVAAPSATAIIYQLLQIGERVISRTTATCLLTGLISRTRNFKTPNVNPTSLKIAAELIELGAERDLIINKLYRNRSLKLLKLWGFVLAKLTPSKDKKLLWSALSSANFIAADANLDDLVALCEELIAAMPETLAVTIFIHSPEDTRVLLYSIKHLDALYLLQDYQAVGSKKLAECHLTNADSIEFKDVIAAIEQRLTALNLE